MILVCNARQCVIVLRTLFAYGVKKVLKIQASELYNMRLPFDHGDIISAGECVGRLEYT